MDRKTLIIVGVLVVVAVATTLIEKKGTPKKSAKIGEVVLSKTDLSKVSQIVIKNADKTLTIKSQDNQWQLADSFPADAGKVIEFFESLEKSKFLRKISDTEEKWQNLELTGEKRLELSGDGFNKTIYLGKDRPGGGQYLRIDDEPEAYLVDPSIAADAENSAWEYRRLVALGKDQIKAVSFPQGAESFTISREAKDKPFSISDLKENETMKETSGLANLLASLDYSKRVGRTPAFEKGLTEAPMVRITTLDDDVYQVKIVTLEQPNDKAAGNADQKPQVKKLHYIYIESDAKNFAAMAPLMQRWQFEISEYQANDFKRARADFVKKSQS